MVERVLLWSGCARYSLGEVGFVAQVFPLLFLDLGLRGIIPPAVPGIMLSRDPHLCGDSCTVRPGATVPSATTVLYRTAPLWSLGPRAGSLFVATVVVAVAVFFAAFALEDVVIGCAAWILRS